MTSTARIEANRRNARLSTGPRTRAGKARAAQNARRHGLSLQARCDPAWAGEIEALAAAIAGAGADPLRCELAGRIAAAQIDVQRARAVRRELLPRALAEPEGIKRLAAIDFYERCALARRKAAIRDFDAAPDFVKTNPRFVETNPTRPRPAVPEHVSASWNQLERQTRSAPSPRSYGERGGVRGISRSTESIRPSPLPSQPKSDISDFGQSLGGRTRVKPEFGCKRGEGAHRVWRAVADQSQGPPTALASAAPLQSGRAMRGYARAVAGDRGQPRGTR